MKILIVKYKNNIMKEKIIIKIIYEIIDSVLNPF